MGEGWIQQTPWERAGEKKRHGREAITWKKNTSSHLGITTRSSQRQIAGGSKQRAITGEDLLSMSLEDLILNTWQEMHEDDSTGEEVAAEANPWEAALFENMNIQHE
uniref:Uncharacterized protein n=1 Tax=Aegilops tauschii TaxID=37682 RepID=R7W069_AEGTA